MRPPRPSGGHRHPHCPPGGLPRPSIGDHRSVLGMPGKLRQLAAHQVDLPVFYLSTVPSRFQGHLDELMHRRSHPPGTLLLCRRSRRGWWLSSRRQSEWGALQLTVAAPMLPEVRTGAVLGWWFAWRRSLSVPGHMEEPNDDLDERGRRVA